MPNIEQNCLNCNKLFITTTTYVKRGYGKFCSRSCSSTYNTNKRPKADKSPNIKCAYCSNMFFANEYRKKQTKSGMLFCSRECKDLALQLTSGEKFSEMRPAHYGDIGVTYRRLKLQKVEELKCEECGYNKHPEILQVHHIDRDRTNNTIDNLKLLCPTCHEEDHFLNNDGRWNNKRSRNNLYFGGP